jgi:hypothetical protein
MLSAISLSEVAMNAVKAITEAPITRGDSKSAPIAPPTALTTAKAPMDLSRFDAAPLIAFTATKETDYGTETNRRI